MNQPFNLNLRFAIHLALLLVIGSRAGLFLVFNAEFF